MAEVLLPPDICPESETIELVDDGSSVFSPAQGRSVMQVQQDYEPRLRVVQRFRALRGSDRARMIAALRRVSGKYGTIRAQIGRVLRGSFPATELLTNNTFASGTTGWTVTGATLVVADRIARLIASGPSASLYFYRTYTPPLLNAPVVMRSMIADGSQSAGLLVGNAVAIGHDTPDTYSTARGLKTVSGVPSSIAAQNAFSAVIQSSTGYAAGTYVDCAYSSVSRCFLADNGANLLTYSDQFDNAAWSTSEATISANAGTAPDGTSTADSVLETTANSLHYTYRTAAVTVSASANDYSFSICLVRNNRQFAWLQMSTPTGVVYHLFDLTNGTLGTTSFTGSGWSNLRAHIKSVGALWYVCTITARKTDSAVAITAFAGPSSGDNRNAYVGNASNGVFSWRATLAQSSVPTRLVQTTSAAVAATAQTGSALYVKGLPVSTSGLLTADDVVEVNGELLQLTASLDSDAAGLGYLQFAPSLFRSPSDNDPVIVNAPMPKLKLVENPKWSNEWGVQSDLELTFEQFYE